MRKDYLEALEKAYAAIEEAQENTDTTWESNHLQTIKLMIDEMLEESKAPVFTFEELL